MMIRPFLSIRVLEPGASVPIQKNVQDRTMFEYRNKGFGFVLDQMVPSSIDFPQAPSSALVDFRDAPPLPLSNHPICIETMSQLRALHHPRFAYRVISRKTYHIPTFQTLVGIAADPHEPITSVEEARDPVDFRHIFSSADREFRDKWLKCNVTANTKLSSKGKTASIAAVASAEMRSDCITTGKHCSAWVTSCTELTEEFLVAQVAKALFTHALWKDGGCSHQRFTTAWNSFFCARPHPPKIYIGVGASEFGDGSNEVETESLTQQARAAVTKPEGNMPPWLLAPSAEILQSGIEPQLLLLAKQLGVTLLRRHHMRYYVLRDG